MEKRNSNPEMPDEFYFTEDLDCYLNQQYQESHPNHHNSSFIDHSTVPMFLQSRQNSFQLPQELFLSQSHKTSSVMTTAKQQSETRSARKFERRKTIKKKHNKNKKNGSANNATSQQLEKQIQQMAKKIEELQEEVKTLKATNLCDRCVAKENLPMIPCLSNQMSNLSIQTKEDGPTPAASFNFQMPKQYAKLIGQESDDKKDIVLNRQFEHFQIGPALMMTPKNNMDVSGQIWIIMGLLMMLMGININGYDGTIDIYKITRQNVDYLRKQVEKSADIINFPVFFSKVFSLEGSLGMSNEFGQEGFELEGLRLESVDEEELMFEEHLNFKLKYQALIVMMEYMRQYASLQ